MQITLLFIYQVVPVILLQRRQLIKFPDERNVAHPIVSHWSCAWSLRTKCRRSVVWGSLGFKLQFLAGQWRYRLAKAINNSEVHPDELAVAPNATWTTAMTIISQGRIIWLSKID
jgi:hypothetical protein